MSIEDPKISSNENESSGDDNSGSEQEATEKTVQDEQQRLKRFIWTDGDFEFEDDA